MCSDDVRWCLFKADVSVRSEFCGDEVVVELGADEGIIIGAFVNVCDDEFGLQLFECSLCVFCEVWICVSCGMLVVQCLNGLFDVFKGMCFPCVQVFGWEIMRMGVHVDVFVDA